MMQCARAWRRTSRVTRPAETPGNRRHVTRPFSTLRDVEYRRTRERRLCMSLPVVGSAGEALSVLSRFRVELYDCLYARAGRPAATEGGRRPDRAGRGCQQLAPLCCPDQRGPAVLARLRARRPQLGPVRARLALLLRHRPGDRPHLLDHAAGRGALGSADDTTTLTAAQLQVLGNEVGAGPAVAGRRPGDLDRDGLRLRRRLSLPRPGGPAGRAGRLVVWSADCARTGDLADDLDGSRTCAPHDRCLRPRAGRVPADV